MGLVLHNYTAVITLAESGHPAWRAIQDRETFGAAMGAVRAVCGGWLQDLLLDWQRGRLQVVLPLPRSIDPDVLADVLPMALHRDLCKLGLLRTDPKGDEFLRSILEKHGLPLEGSPIPSARTL